MLKPPKLPWQIRLAALVVAAAMSYHVVEIYLFGAKASYAVGYWLKKAGEPAVAAPQRKSEPGVVPIILLNENKSAH